MKTRPLPCGPLCLRRLRHTLLAGIVFAASASPALAQTFTFTPAHPDWSVSIDGGTAVFDPTLVLMRGHQYSFDVTVGDFHTFYINTENGTGSTHAYSGGGLSANGVATDTIITFDVPLTAPDILFYNCGIHAPMFGRIEIAIFRSGFD